MAAQARSGIAPSTLSFQILGQHVQVRCDRAEFTSVLSANFGALSCTPPEGPPDLHYSIARSESTGAISLCSRTDEVAVADIDDLLFHLEKDLTVALQQRRPDLLFLHAAALQFHGKAWLLVGESGHGKSTTAWGLLHHGFGYLSDELSPIDLGTLQVLPYPHALCLKERPAAGYPLPAGVLDLGDRLHVPVQHLPAAAAPAPCKLAAVIFVRHDHALRKPVLRAIGPAEAGARMYLSTLNALAHPHHGLDAVVRVVRSARCYSLECADLRRTCEEVVRLAREDQPVAASLA